jgi:hypothetical protein
MCGCSETGIYKEVITMGSWRYIQGFVQDTRGRS